MAVWVCRGQAAPDIGWMVRAPGSRDIRCGVCGPRGPHFFTFVNYFGSGCNCPFVVGIKYPSTLTR